MGLSKAYLLAYNSLMAVGWGGCLYQIASHVLTTGGDLSGAYSVAGDTVALFQLISGLEIAHAALGLVGGSPVTAAMQWGGRSNVLFGVVRAVPEVQRGLAVGAMLLAWSLSEVVRYPWYAASLARRCPHWLTWLRYTAFIPLYPVGVVGEMAAVFQALPAIAARRLRSFSLPNPWNMSFEYRSFLVLLLAAYPFLWFQLYSFLFRQRAKKLGAGGGGSSKPPSKRA